mgnify:CR=1 FL=1
MKNKVVKFIVRYVVITLSAIMYGLGIGLFLNPNQLAPGGISGIAIILKEVFPMLPGVGVLIIIINVPIMILGAWKFGKKFLLSTLYSLIVSSVAIDALPAIFKIDAVTNDLMLASVIGGALFGFAMGVLFRMDTTTGGLDIIVKIIKQKHPHMKTGQIYMIIDVAILIASAIAFNNVEVALFAAIAIYVSSLAMDKAIYVGDEATLVYIISKQRKIISVRMLQGRGAYTNKSTEIIMCVMRKQMLVKVRNILKEVDPDAFMIVTTANEVFGEGFKSQFTNEV